MMQRLVITCSFLIAAVAMTASSPAQESIGRHITVEAEELPSAYGAPPDLSHGRISTLTKSYVLSPFTFEWETEYEGAVSRHDARAHLFREEIEMGLPARLTLGLQNEVEHFAGETHERQPHSRRPLCAR